MKIEDWGRSHKAKAGVEADGLEQPVLEHLVRVVGREAFQYAEKVEFGYYAYPTSACV